MLINFLGLILQMRALLRLQYVTVVTPPVMSGLPILWQVIARTCVHANRIAMCIRTLAIPQHSFSITNLRPGEEGGGHYRLK
jgi:hypothetical protein